MQNTGKGVVFAILAVVVVLVALTCSAVASYVPESQIRFSSLELTERTQSGCVVHPSSLAIEMEFDCRFDILLPDAELPANVNSPLSLQAKLKCIFHDFSTRDASPMGIASVSVPVENLVHCQLFVDTRTTYNVVPGAPLPVAQFVDESGNAQTAYVVARTRD